MCAAVDMQVLGLLKRGHRTAPNTALRALHVYSHPHAPPALLPAHLRARRFGHPVPTQVTLNPVPGQAILVTGHDMHDLDTLLQQTAGTGINVYTHGEMLPGELRCRAHARRVGGGVPPRACMCALLLGQRQVLVGQWGTALHVAATGN